MLLPISKDQTYLYVSMYIWIKYRNIQHKYEYATRVVMCSDICHRHRELAFKVAIISELL
jgi:hypothetical protein